MRVWPEDQAPARGRAGYDDLYDIAESECAAIRRPSAYGIWTGDPSERVKGCIGRLIDAVIPALERLGFNDFIQDPHPIKLADLRMAAERGLENADGFLESIVTDRRDKLATWAADCRIVDMDPGSMGTAVDADGQCGSVDLVAHSLQQDAA